MMRHGSLFSGIGGFDLAAERVGWRNVYHVERDPFCQTVLKHHFPNSRSFEKIEEFDGFTPIVDVITGGFPCQPFSNAGQRKGIADDRYLWPEMFRVIGNARPRWVVAENVSGLVRWSGGLVLDTVCADLENIGYDVGAFLVPACGANAPHRRERIWIVANAKHATTGTNGGSNQKTPPEIRRDAARNVPGTFTRRRVVANTIGTGKRQDNRQGKSRFIDKTLPFTNWKEFPTISPIRCGNDGVPDTLDGLTVSKWRRQSLKAYGNAIVPVIAQRIFETIQAVEDGLTSWDEVK